MKYKKLMLVTCLLLAILTISAVSASDSAIEIDDNNDYLSDNLQGSNDLDLSSDDSNNLDLSSDDSNSPALNSKDQILL